MKILHLTAVKNWGGGGNHIENLCYELSKSNPEVKNIIVVAKNGQFHERLKSSGFNYKTIPLLFNLDPRAIYQFIRICRTEKIDLVHVHGSTSITLAVIASTLAKLPPFIFSKKTSFPIKQRKQTLWKYNHPQIKKILCVSEITRTIAEKAITDKKKLKTIYHGTRIDSKSTKTPFILREKFGIPQTNSLVGNIGNHIKAKDLETWISTIDHIVNKQKITNVSFVQIGTFTELTPHLKEKIRDLHLEKYVHFTGYLANASNFMKQFDLLLITSQSEGLPQVIYEAFYHKTPVVSTDVGGIPEIIEDNFTGILSEKKDAPSLAENTLKLLNNKEMTATFTARAYEKLFPRFTSEFMAQETLREYETILKK